MEGIVVGIAQINFHQNLSGVTDENSAPNFAIEKSANMSISETFLAIRDDTAANDGSQDVESIFGETSGAVGDSGWEEIDDDEDKGSSSKKGGLTLAERRQMPTRASKESSLLGIKRRTIMKPSKRSKNSENFQSLKPSDIKKIYLNKKLTNFRPSSLETIFEESPAAQSNEPDYMRLMGGRKIKRSLSCTDGFKQNKILVNKRRAKIKKTFGKRFALKKISLEEFITKLNKSMEEIDEAKNDCHERNEHKTNVSFCPTSTKISASEMFVSNISDVGDEAMNYKNIPTTEISKESTNNMSL